MLDEVDRLRAHEPLQRLLDHYAHATAGDREAWQDRVMKLEGVPTQELTRLHGELIAYGWVEQNTGITPVLKPGAAGNCYRVTTAGSRALHQAGTDRHTDEDAAEAA